MCEKQYFSYIFPAESVRQRLGRRPGAQLETLQVVLEAVINHPINKFSSGCHWRNSCSVNSAQTDLRPTFKKKVGGGITCGYPLRSRTLHLLLSQGCTSGQIIHNVKRVISALKQGRA